MKASEALQKPGDVARRESDKAVALCTIDDDTAAIYLFYANGDYVWVPVKELTGDDWQPPHPAGEHAAEVKRLTAERDMARRERDSFREKRDAARAKGRLAAAQAVERERAIAALTARVAELESGIRDAMLVLAEGDGGRGVCHYSAEGEMRVLTLGGLIRQLSRIVGDDTHPGDDEASAFSPLPTAGDEADQGWLTPGRKILYAPSSDRYFVGRVRAKPHTLCDGTPVVHLHEMEPAYAEYTGKKGDKAHSVYAAAVCNCQPYREARPAPAEPDSPAEGPAKPSGVGERIHKAALDEPCWMHRDGEWTEAKFDPFCPHPQYRRAAEHRKPSCLDGVPAVLCEYRCDYTPAQRWWVYGAVVDGRVAGVQDGKTGRPAIWHLMYLTPIHHDHTDAAAVELRGRIAEGGAE